MGITGAYFVERDNLQQILNGDAGQPDLDIDKAWSLIAAMFPDIPLVPVTSTYHVESTLTELGTFYLSAEQVAHMAEKLPELKETASLQERIHFEDWKHRSTHMGEHLDHPGSADRLEDMAQVMPLMFTIHEEETYEDIVEGYLLPYLDEVFTLFEQAAAERAGIVFAIF
ncbi:hypothetical protein [Paenibacillus wenxiniae]|uniref:DUF1877 family protein n=1 Tax=Paenibacillus wenxiniae TaxID=1636843 RepID=A0ABW4RCY6_9BACL